MCGIDCHSDRNPQPVSPRTPFMTREEYLKLKPGDLLFGGHDSKFGLIVQPFDGEVCIMEARNSLTPFDEEGCCR